MKRSGRADAPLRGGHFLVRHGGTVVVVSGYDFDGNVIPEAHLVASDSLDLTLESSRDGYIKMLRKRLENEQVEHRQTRVALSNARIELAQVRAALDEYWWRKFLRRLPW